MNEMDLLTRFRAEVPLRVSPHAEELFDAGIHDHSAERPVVQPPRNLFARIRMPWRLAIAAGVAAGLAVGLVAAVQPSGPPPVLTAKLLADRASAAALAGPTVPAGHWIYQQTLNYTARPPKGFPARLTEGTWSTADGSPNSAIAFTETALLKTTLVFGPGSTKADPAPPSPAELAAEQAAMALLNAHKSGPFGLPDPGRWIYRKIDTQEVWARADDTEQASYVHGTLVTCDRSTDCASDTTWLMPAGPAYSVLDPSAPLRGPVSLPDDPQALLGKLNTYGTGCTDSAGYCDAVGVFANMLIGYSNVGISPVAWYFSLADVPGVAVKHITDSAGRADVEFSFPFTNGVTGILFDARTYQFTGYVKGGVQTLLLQQANVSGPGVRP
jgi:hypothetical protein